MHNNGHAEYPSRNALSSLRMAVTVPLAYDCASPYTRVGLLMLDTRVPVNESVTVKPLSRSVEVMNEKRHCCHCGTSRLISEE